MYQANAYGWVPTQLKITLILCAQLALKMPKPLIYFFSNLIRYKTENDLLISILSIKNHEKNNYNNNFKRV